MRRRDRVPAHSKGATGGVKNGMGNVHPNPPASVHNPIRMICPITANRAMRQADYQKRHGS